MATKKAAKKKRTAKYGPGAKKSVEREMKAFKKGKLKSGSGAKVKNPKQAIAIALSEARASGAKVPPAKKAGAKKTASRKTAAKKSTGRKSAAKKSK